MKIKNCKYNSIELAIKFAELGQKILDLNNTQKIVFTEDLDVLENGVLGIKTNYFGLVSFILDRDNIHCYTYESSLMLLTNYFGFNTLNNFKRFCNSFDWKLKFLIIPYSIWVRVFSQDLYSLNVLSIVQHHVEIADKLRFKGVFK